MTTDGEGMLIIDMGGPIDIQMRTAHQPNGDHNGKD